jgi:hypothetical protein
VDELPALSHYCHLMPWDLPRLTPTELARYRSYVFAALRSPHG